MLIFLILLQAFVFGFFCSYIAGEKNRGQVGWFFLGFFFSILSVLALIAVPKLDKPSVQLPPTLDIKDATKQCPDCAETIKLEAKICRFCQRNFSEAEIDSQILLFKKTNDKTQPVIEQSTGNFEVIAFFVILAIVIIAVGTGMKF